MHAFFLAAALVPAQPSELEVRIAASMAAAVQARASARKKVECEHCEAAVPADASWWKAPDGKWGLWSGDTCLGYWDGTWYYPYRDGKWGHPRPNTPINPPRQEGGAAFPGSASVMPNQTHYLVLPDSSFLAPSCST